MKNEAPESLRRLYERGLGGNTFVDVEPEVDGHTVERLLGQGGMGSVYLARNDRLGRAVALKVLRAASDSPEATRLLREGQALARLNHPHIITVYDVLRDRGGRPCLALEYIPGGDLAQRLQAGAIPKAEALRTFRDIVLAVAHAHDQGIVHRDLKPANILFDAQGRVKVGDFGLAAIRLDAPGTALTLSGTTAGTEAYMSPEQKEGRGTDARADLYGLGVLLYEMLTGRRPQGIFAPLDDPRLDRVVRRCLRERADDRYPDAHALLADLDRRPRRWTRAALAGPLLVAAAAAVWLRTRPPDTVPVPPPPARGTHMEALDLLVQPEAFWRDAIRLGTWEVRQGYLHTRRDHADSPAWIAFPFDPGERYDFEVRLVREQGIDSLPVFLATRAGTVAFEIDAWREGLAGFQEVDGRDLRHSGLAIAARHRNGQADELRFQVRTDAVRVWVNGVERGPLPLAGRRLAPPAAWQTPPDLRWGVGAWEADARFETLRWRRAAE